MSEKGDIMDLTNSMTQEEQRYVREGFESDEELSLYDMFFRDDLSKEEIKELKKVAVDLLKKIKGKIAELIIGRINQKPKQLLII